MSFTRRTAQLLHEDHQGTIEVIEALDQLIAKARKKAPDVSDAAVNKTLTKASVAIEDEISNHFAFEENELFTRLEEMGDVGIGEHLRSEHAALLPLGKTVAEGARAALQGGFTDQTWPPFRNAAAELIERMFSHIQKEEMALLPALEDLLDPETDMQLSSAYEAAHL
ncbi:MAG: hemerythrin domain-containing protein [Antarcticimicrobium sp.]|uniref:hemerythrin domain-containing protein n=1 Tax=Antarcticimicrobium sp. TaxID=2824147 RepID=UPI0026047C73|nr:hemerythrin domain-containing protein [Antarcticimicrobium sp.]MDF1717746.1 hemerythrin domain-containing protein [Antarcticimicrobium sp.]